MTRERGSATVLTAGGVALLLALTVAALGLAQAAAGARRASAAADLAALAVAAAVADGSTRAAACAAGEDIATRNGSRLDRCLVSGTFATVQAQVPVELPSILGGTRWATASARAGPEPVR